MALLRYTIYVDYIVLYWIICAIILHRIIVQILVLNRYVLIYKTRIIILRRLKFLCFDKTNGISLKREQYLSRYLLSILPVCVTVWTQYCHKSSRSPPFDPLRGRCAVNGGTDREIVINELSYSLSPFSLLPVRVYDSSSSSSFCSLSTVFVASRSGPTVLSPVVCIYGTLRYVSFFYVCIV